MILDTEFLISLQAESPDALELAAEFESEGVPTRLPTIVLEELYVGVGASEHATRTSAGTKHSAHKPIIPLDENISRRAGVLKGQHPRAAPNRRSVPVMLS